jgi:hypothetical protein
VNGLPANANYKTVKEPSRNLQQNDCGDKISLKLRGIQVRGTKIKVGALPAAPGTKQGSHVFVTGNSVVFSIMRIKIRKRYLLFIALQQH